MTEPTLYTRPERRWLREMQVPERVSGVFTVVNAQIGQKKNGEPYLRCLLGDKTMTVPCRKWSVDEGLLASIESEGFAYVEGETQAYQGELQVVVTRFECCTPPAEDLRDLMPASEHEPAEMLSELRALLERELGHPAMRALVQTYLSDEKLMEAFSTAPAAKSMHHAYLGGLLEHTLSVVRLASTVCPLYPRVSKDLVLVGLFLHDLGKTRELRYDAGFGYTDRGELVGHIVEGAIMLHDKAQQMMATTGQRLPPRAVTVLQHIILSHHGEPEYGAAKVPSTPEAILVSMLDNLDAKLTMALDAARPKVPPAAASGDFTEKVWALGTKLYRRDPLA